jgi:hypothetical protein
VPTCCNTIVPDIVVGPISLKDGVESVPDTTVIDVVAVEIVSPVASDGEKSNESVTCSFGYIGEKSRAALGIRHVLIYWI